MTKSSRGLGGLSSIDVESGGAMTRFVTMIAVAMFVALAFGFSVSSALAASPAWRVLGAAAPTHLPADAGPEVQHVAVDATGGTFRLTLPGVGTTGAMTTVALPANASAATVQSAFAAAHDPLPGADPSFRWTESGTPVSVTVTGGPGDAGATTPYVVTFNDSRSVSQMTADSSSLTGGAALATVSTVRDGVAGNIGVYVANVGGADSSGAITLTIGPLPAGITTSATPTGLSWSCTPGAGQTTVTCTRTLPLPAGGMSQQPVVVPVAVGPSASPSSTVPLSVEGGGALPDPDENNTYEMPVTISSKRPGAGVQAFWAGAFDADGRPATQAGGHPHTAAAFFLLNTELSPDGRIVPAGGDPRDIAVELPPGFLGNPLVTPRCPQHQLIGDVFGNGCPPSSVLGYVHARTFGTWPGQHSPEAPEPNSSIYNNVPGSGHAAQFTFPYNTAQITTVASLRSDGDYGATVTAPNTPSYLKVWGAYTMLQGNPAGAAGKAFFTNGMDCAGEALTTPLTTIVTNTWQQPLLFDRRPYGVPAVTGCDELEFEPSFAFQPDTNAAASPAGTTADLSVPQDGLLDPDELASPHLKKSVVTLPEGLVLNPSAADGLAACSTDQIGLKGTGFAEPNPIRFDKSHPECPDASKVGTVEVDTPLLDDKLHGTVYLAAQGDNPFGSLIALYVVIDDAKTGITVKLPGKVEPDPVTGRLTATFDHNPQVPFSNLKLRFRSGPRAALATPDVCGDYTTVGVWTPWSAPDSGPPAETENGFSVSGGPDCPQSKAQRPFSLGFDAGATSQAAGSFAPFVLRLAKPDGSQELDRVEVTLPEGFAASLRAVPYCSEAAIAQAVGRTAKGTGALERAFPSCPAASRIGSTSIGAGVGPNPFYAGGDVYLAGSYKGAPLSMVFVVPAIAGPFDLGVQVVRTALHVDRSTARVTAVSDTIPKILEGVPLQIKDVRVDIDRPAFTINPTSCAPKRVASTISGATGATAQLGSPFHATGCAALPFKPKLALRLTGKRQAKTGKHPGIKAQVTQSGVGEAGIEKAVVRLPKSLALDPDNAQTLCEFEDGTKPDLESHCPEGSIVGRARAKTPLLKNDLVGNVYFVKNVRTDPKTGNTIRTLPMIIVALRGEIAVNLKGESSTTKAGRLVNTFASIPDAPISRFNLNIKGGRNGILVVTRTRKSRINLCAGRHIAEADMDGHNGKRHDRNVRMKTPCTKRQTRAAKRQAKRAAAKGQN